MLSVGENDSKWLEGVRTSLLKFSLPCESMTSPEIRNRYPMIQYPNSHVAVLDPEAGIINADRCLQALWVNISLSRQNVMLKEKVFIVFISLNRQTDNPVAIKLLVWGILA